MIKSEIVAHSLSPQGDELITILATFPRIILAEVNTHRMLSKNTSSSRAIPFEKMLEAIENNPFIPIAWQREHKGMQGNQYSSGIEQREIWLRARNNAIEEAKYLSDCDTTKQICNRLLEPFMWTTMLITGSREGWDNFFRLRCPQYEYVVGDLTCNFKSKKDYINYISLGAEENYWHSWNDVDWLKLNKGQAEIHMMALAEAIWDSVNESTPKQLKPREWHIPFEDKISPGIKLYSEEYDFGRIYKNSDEAINMTKVKISVTMAARTSYTIVGEEKELNYENLLGLHDRLLNQQPPHSSPFEHTARAMNDLEYESFVKGEVRNYSDTMEGYQPEQESFGWCFNLKGFIPYRYLVDNSLTL